MKKYLVIFGSSLILFFLIRMIPAYAKVVGGDGYILEHEQDIAKPETGPHDGGGETTAFPFFAKANDLKIVFRKRILYPGSSIGYHLQEADEIYYVVAGRGEMKMNDKTFPVTAGDAILTRPGNWHSLKPAGTDTLTVLINYINNAVKN